MSRREDGTASSRPLNENGQATFTNENDRADEEDKPETVMVNERVTQAIELFPVTFKPYLSNVESHANQLIGRLRERLENSWSGTLLAELRSEFRTSSGYLSFAGSLLRSGIHTFLPESYQEKGRLLDLRILRKSNENLEKLLEEQKVILRENHHRITNNLDVLISLLSLRRQDTETFSADVLDKVIGTLKSMKTIHQKLEPGVGNSTKPLNVDSFVRELCGAVVEGLGRDSERVALDVRVELPTISARKALPLGIILNELVSNALRSESTDAPPRVKVKLSAHGETAVLTVSDDGSGSTEATKASEPSMGLEIVQQLAENQLAGTFEQSDTSSGTAWLVTFNPQEERNRKTDGETIAGTPRRTRSSSNAPASRSPGARKTDEGTRA